MEVEESGFVVVSYIHRHLSSTSTIFARRDDGAVAVRGYVKKVPSYSRPSIVTICTKL